MLVTIAAAGQFVLQHLPAQMQCLAVQRGMPPLQACCAGDGEHRRDAQRRAPGTIVAARAWRRLAGSGSAAGVISTRRQ